MMAMKIAPALAAGCTVVLKPSDKTPLSALLVGELVVQAGFPSGVINILCGHGSEIGKVRTPQDFGALNLIRSRVWSSGARPAHGGGQGGLHRFHSRRSQDPQVLRQEVRVLVLSMHPSTRF